MRRATWGRAAPGTTSRWCTTASSTATCSSSPRSTTCCTAAPGCSAREIADIFSAWNDGELRSYLIEITAQVLRARRPGDRQAAGRRDPRRGAAEGHRQVDEPERVRPRRADPDDQRRRREPHPISALKAERVAASRVLHGPDAARSPAIAQQLVDAARARALRQQDHVLRAGHGAAADGVGRVRLRPRPGRGRQDLARRLHHPRRAARRHHATRSGATRPWSTCCSTTRSGDAGRPSRQAAGAIVVQTAVGLGIPVPGARARRWPTSTRTAARGCRPT